MTTHSERFARRDSAAGGQQYLEATVQTASPARLRLMLIERAIGVAACLSGKWRSGEQLGTNEHSIKLLDILNELLSGIVGGKTESENQLCQKVSDLYVFLSQHLVAAESGSDADSIDEIKTVLEAEAETWRAVCAQEQGSQIQAPTTESVATSGGLNLEA